MFHLITIIGLLLFIYVLFDNVRIAFVNISRTVTHNGEDTAGIFWCHGEGYCSEIFPHESKVKIFVAVMLIEI